MSGRTPVSGERSALGPEWKSEARGQWRRDHRKAADGSSTPVVLRIRESRASFGWEVWRGNNLVRAGDASSVAEAALAAEGAATGSTPYGSGSEQLSAALDRALAGPGEDGGARTRAILLGVVVMCWVAQFRAVWLGVASPLMLAATALATLGLYWQVAIRRVV
jgi:hypothetical protein